MLCEWNKKELLELEFVDCIFFIQFLNLTEWITSAWCVVRWRHKMGQGTRPSMCTCSFQIFFCLHSVWCVIWIFCSQKTAIPTNFSWFYFKFQFQLRFYGKLPIRFIDRLIRSPATNNYNKISYHIYAFQPTELFLSTFILYSVQFIAFYHTIFPLKYVLP